MLAFVTCSLLTIKKGEILLTSSLLLLLAACSWCVVSVLRLPLPLWILCALLRVSSYYAPRMPGNWRWELLITGSCGFLFLLSSSSFVFRSAQKTRCVLLGKGKLARFSKCNPCCPSLAHCILLVEDHRGIPCDGGRAKTTLSNPSAANGPGSLVETGDGVTPNPYSWGLLLVVTTTRHSI